MKLLVFLLVSCLVGVAHANPRVARIIYYGGSSNHPQTVFLHQANAKSLEVELAAHNFSESFDLLPGATRIGLIDSALPEGAALPEGTSFVDLPEDWNKVLIIAFVDELNLGQTVQLKAINANDDQFGPGELFFVNFSEMTVLGQVGDKTLLSKPHATDLIKDPRSGRGTYMLKLNAYKDDPKQLRRLIQQKCQYDPKDRIVTFMVPLAPPRMVKVYSAPIKDF